MTETAGLHSASGVVLKRSISAEGDLVADLFLKEFGRTSAVAKGAGRGSVRFGGATEPLIWGTFNLYKGKGRFIINSIDIKHDCLRLRSSEARLISAIKWVKLLIKYVEERRPDDKVLSCFYWSLILLEEGVPVQAAEFRFIWRWLNIWGIAPELNDEILLFVAKSDHETIKNIKEVNDPKHLDLLHASSEKFVLLFNNMI